MNNKNKWICIPRHTKYIAKWNALFDIHTNIDQAIRIVDYIDKFLNLGKKYQILEYDNINLQQNNVPKMPYIDQLYWLINNQSILSFFTGLPDASRSGKQKTKISYFDKSNIMVTKHVDNIGKLFREINWGTRLNVPPIYPIFERILPINNQQPEPRTLVLGLCISSDIWFPYVLDGMNEEFWENWGDGIYTPVSNHTTIHHA